MKQKPGMVTQALGDGEYMVVPTVGDNLNRVLSLNGSGAFVWKLLEQRRSLDELAALVASEYEVQPEQARDDLKEFLSEIRDFIDT